MENLRDPFPLKSAPAHADFLSVNGEHSPARGTEDDLRAQDRREALRARARKGAKLRLLRDLVQDGVYVVDSALVAQSMMDRLLPPRP